MKAISLTQPYATALFLQLSTWERIKGIETRSWKPPKQTEYPYRIAIHASKAYPKWARQFTEVQQKRGWLPASEFPLGEIIGAVTVLGVRRTEDICRQISPIELSYGDYSDGRWAWMLGDPVLLRDPIPCKGALGLWNIPKEIGTLNLYSY